MSPIPLARRLRRGHVRDVGLRRRDVRGHQARQGAREDQSGDGPRGREQRVAGAGAHEAEDEDRTAAEPVGQAPPDGRKEELQERVRSQQDRPSIAGDAAVESRRSAAASGMTIPKPRRSVKTMRKRMPREDAVALARLAEVGRVELRRAGSSGASGTGERRSTLPPSPRPCRRGDARAASSGFGLSPLAGLVGARALSGRQPRDFRISAMAFLTTRSIPPSASMTPSSCSCVGVS